MADKIKFLAGKLADLANKPKVQGQVYFAIDGETGKIAFDVDGQTRVFMDKASSADSATQDSAGNVISKYIKTIQLLSGDDTRFQYILGDGSYVPSKTTGIRLNFVSRAGDTMTGLLTARGGILVNTATNTQDLIISRTGSATSECTTFGQDDQGLIIKSINDEASTYIRFDMEATDMEANAGAGANSGTITFGLSGGKTTVTADYFSGQASSAVKDTSGNTIASTFIKNLILQNHATQPYYQLQKGTGDVTSTVNLPVASADYAGVITNAAQTLSGTKTFDSKGAVIITKAAGFNYTGIEKATAAAYRDVWFADSTRVGTPVHNSIFQFNPGCTDKWTSFDTDTPTAYGSLKADRFTGLAQFAAKDNMGNVLSQKYIYTITLNDDGAQPYYTLKNALGSILAKVNLPVASATYAGVVTTGAQTFAGLKTFNDSIFVNGKVSIANKGNTVEIGADNEGYFHFLVRKQATTPLTFWFGGPIQAMGNITPYDSDTYTLGTSSQRWKGGYFGSEGLTVSGAILDRDSSELRASLFVHSFYVKTNSATELTIGGKNTIGNPITNASVQIPNATTTTAGIVTAGAQTFAGPKTIVHSTTTNARKSSALILSSNSNKPIGLEFWRGDGANCGSWQVVNDSGNLIFRTDYNDGVQTTYSVGSLQLHYTTGAAQAPYVWVNGANASYRLYVSGASYLTSTLVLGSTLTLNNGTLNRAASKPLIFQINGSTHARFDVSGHFLPEATNTYNMGSSSLHWKNVYATTFNGALNTNNIVLQNAAAAQYGRLYIATEGTACATAGTAGTTGVALLILGNSTAVSSTVGEGANNARGRIRLYGTGANYIQLQANPKTETNNYTFTLPPYEGNMYAAHTGSTDAVGSGVKPVYVGASGRITASSSTVGSGIKPIYLNAGTLTVSSSTVGSGIIPVFLNAGTLTASTSTIGSGIKPMFLNAGTLTASSSTVGSGVVPMFLSSGTLTASTSTVGSGIKPIYLNAGTLTVSSSTVGTSDRPVYLSSGTISQTTYRMAATNTKADSGVDIGSTPQTGIWYVTGTSGILSQSDGVAIVNHYNTNWISQIYQDYRTGQIALRGKNNGTWQSWRTVIDTGNYTTHLDGRYVNVTGDSMSGTLSWGGNIASLNLRAGHADYNGVISYQTSGNEAFLFTTKNTVTSFIFANGEDTITNMAADRWTKITPAVQIKNNCVYIGSLIANGSTPSYKFYVNGTSYFNGVMTTAGLLTITTNGVSTTYGCQNGSYSHNSTTASTGHWFNKNVYVQGNIYAGTSYADLVLTTANYAANIDGRYVNVTGDTMTGTLRFYSSNGIYARHIDGENATFAGDLYLNYNVNAPIHVGKGGSYTISADGSYYSGNAATANSLSGKFYANRMINPNNSGVRTGAPPLSVLGLMNSGYGVYTDPEFAAGSNSVYVYNNSGNGTVVHTRVADSTAANTSGYVLKITHSGTASPGWGGFYQNISSRANAVYAQIFRAKIPVGYSVVAASNSMGTNYSDYWITDQAGTGKWEWYCRIVLCGESGSFSGGGHVYLTGGTTPTSSAPVSWYLAYCNLFDLTKGAYLSANRIYGAVWNDYAEFRQADSLEPGRVVIEDCSGQMKLASERLQPGANIISDTYGFAIGETDINQTPIAVSGRVLAYPYEDRNTYPLGAAVCSGPNGTISLMTREEIREYPERIIGTVSEIPNYDEWGGNNAKVNGRIWIKVK